MSSENESIQPQHQVCHRCFGAIQNLEGFEISRIAYTLNQYHQPTFNTLKDAAELGCRICRVVWRKLPEHCQSALLDDENAVRSKHDHYHWEAKQSFATRLSLYSFMRHVDIYIDFTSKVGELGGVTEPKVSFFMIPVNLLPESERTPNTCSSGSTSSPESWAVAHKWVSGCLSTHKACQRAESEWYPTRLLELSEAGFARVMDTSVTAPSGRYITLSHRWSNQPSLLLSRGTKAELYENFNIARLPAAIQDASAVCRRLGIRYLWVDTLCIIQDDEQQADWIRESALMGKVYMNSLLNLSALAAADTEHSFFRQRDPLDVNEVRIRTPLKFNTMRPGDVVNEFRLVDRDLWRTSVHESHLSRRAWVTQERLLPVRVLHFGQHQLLWECAELTAAEAYPLGLPKETVTTRSRYKSSPPQIRELITAGTSQNVPDRGLVQTIDIPTMALRTWEEIIRGYSTCKATQGTDKLIAISGLARRMASLIKDDYVVGMWRRHLPFELMWTCDNFSMTEAEYPGPRRPSEYRAPTFSWASMDASIDLGYGVNVDRTDVAILDLRLDFINEDTTGLFTGGYLIIKCRLQRAKIGNPDLLTRHGGHTVHISESNGTVIDIGPPNLDELPDFFDPATRDDLYSVHWSVRKYEESDLWVYYLLLQAVDDDAGAFRRIGTSLLCVETSDQRAYISAGPEAVNYLCLSYNEGWHTIKII